MIFQDVKRNKTWTIVIQGKTHLDKRTRKHAACVMDIFDFELNRILPIGIHMFRKTSWGLRIINPMWIGHYYCLTTAGHMKQGLPQSEQHMKPTIITFRCCHRVKNTSVTLHPDSAADARDIKAHWKTQVRIMRLYSQSVFFKTIVTALATLFHLCLTCCHAPSVSFEDVHVVRLHMGTPFQGEQL